MLESLYLGCVSSCMVNSLGRQTETSLAGGESVHVHCLAESEGITKETVKNLRKVLKEHEECEGKEESER